MWLIVSYIRFVCENQSKSLLCQPKQSAHSQATSALKKLLELNRMQSGGRQTSAIMDLCSFAWPGTAPALTVPLTVVAVQGEAISVLLLSIVGLTTSISTRRAG